MKYAIVLLLVFLCFYQNIKAQIPEGYYSGTENLTGLPLKKQLHQILKNHRVRTYSEFRDTILPDLDEDPDNSDNILLFYKGTSIPKSNFASGGEPDYWNREHTWPSSHGFGDNTDTAYTDVYNLRPSDATVNTSKSNKDFNNVPHVAENQEGEAADTYTNDDFWEPRDAIKGDVARILFYMDTRYESNRLNLELVDRISFSGDPELGVLFTLLLWHLQDPVDEAERARHEKAFGYQENRNPFVDHPDWVADVWGDASAPLLTFDFLNFNNDFGAVAFGDSLVQTYQVNAYNVTSAISATVEAPFSLSIDGESYSDSVGLTDTSGLAYEQFRLHLKFAPLQADGLSYSATVKHRIADGEELNFAVQGKEGELALLPIVEARQKTLGSPVRVSGVVIDNGNNSGNSRVIFDGTAGIVVRSFDSGNESAVLEQGDSVEVSGGLAEYNELLQIEKSPIRINLLKKNAILPEPQLVTLADIGESFESELVRIEGISFDDAGGIFAGGGSGGNFGISDSTGSLILRIGSPDHPLVGTPVPDGVYHITGFVGQFGSDYQISPRTLDDLEMAPVVLPDIITIAAARQKSEGEIVRIKGLVIGGVHNSEHNRVVHDGTAGLVVRGLEEGHESASLQLGDSVVVMGGILDYNGLLEIEQSPVRIELLNSGNRLPDPISVSISEIGELFESQLVRIEGVRIIETGEFETGNLTLTDGNEELILRIGRSTHPLVGSAIPTVSLNLTGYISQDLDDYLIQVNTASDVELSTSVLLARSNADQLDIYPNPARRNFTIDLPEKVAGRVTSIQLMSYDGKVLAQLPIGQQSWSVEDLAPGLYFVSMVIEGKTHYSRLIKE